MSPTLGSAALDSAAFRRGVVLWSFLGGWAPQMQKTDTIFPDHFKLNGLWILWRN